MIEYYLGEKPALEQVPTWICAERAQRDYVLDNLADLVVKPIDGFGGNGVIIGPDASDEALETRRRELLSQPERYIAQETVALSTHPDVRRGRHVPASRRPACLCPPAARTRRFGHRRTSCRPALTRVASRGSRIVNSSSGGGSKDTWILTDRRPPRSG